MIKRSQILGVALATIAFFVGPPATITVHGQKQAPSTSRGKSHSVAVGKLIRSGRSRSGTVRYALLDDEGTMTAYVIGAADVDLEPHVNANVGVTAREVRRGSGSIPYVLAQKVSRLTTAGKSDEPRMLSEEDIEADELSWAMAEFEDAGSETLADLMWKDLDDQVVPAQAQSEMIESLPAGPMTLDEDVVMEGGTYYPGMPEYAPRRGPSARSPFTPYLGASGCGTPNCQACQGGRIGRRGGPFWVRFELLGWVQKGMRTPALVTRSDPGTPAEDAGVLGLNTTEIVFGRQDLIDDVREGGRLVIGKWLDPCLRNGIEVEFFSLGEDAAGFQRSSAGDPILARPFSNALLDEQDAELVAFPGIVAGTVTVVANSELDSFAPRYRRNLWCRTMPVGLGGCNDCVSCKPPVNYRLDGTVGYRYMKLNELLIINERLTTLDSNTLSTFDLTDAFGSSNEFNGAELGLIWDVSRGRLSFELISRLSLGNNRRSVAINGSTTSSAQGVTFTDPGGLLALGSNIGQYRDDKFLAIPEIGANIGYNITPRLRVLFGYSALYWDNAVRPGDQIDLRVNTDLLPPVLDTDGPNLPGVAFRDDSFWVQGLNLGVDWHW